MADLAAEILRQAGKDIPYKNLPESEYAAILTNFGVPQGFAQAIANWMYRYLKEMCLMTVANSLSLSDDLLSHCLKQLEKH